MNIKGGGMELLQEDIPNLSSPRSWFLDRKIKEHFIVAASFIPTKKLLSTVVFGDSPDFAV
jgi:hypothetical protein